MTRRECTGQWRTKTLDMLRELMNGPKTAAELAESCDINRKTVYRAMPVAENCGIVWIERPGADQSKLTPWRFHLCRKPYEKPETVQ